jgi:hypothetical protein
MRPDLMWVTVQLFEFNTFVLFVELRQDDKVSLARTLSFNSARAGLFQLRVFLCHLQVVVGLLNLPLTAA